MTENRLLSARAGSPRVLIVEDDDGTAMLQSRVLKRAGFCVTVAQDTAAAMNAIATDDPDFLIVDNSLAGGRSGISFYRDLCDSGTSKPAILVTGYTDDAVTAHARTAGFQDVMEKAGDYLDRLPGVVARILGRV